MNSSLFPLRDSVFCDILFVFVNMFVELMKQYEEQKEMEEEGKEQEQLFTFLL